MTLATVIRDVYHSNERKEMRKALRKLLPVGGMDWHPSGVYCFWDPESREVLYVGLATNIERRFAQHNGLAGSSAKGNKRRQIDEWFAEHPRLGYSIIVQSAAVVLLERFGLDTSTEIIAIGEGQLIEAHIQQFGTRPPWNAIGGSSYGSTWAGPRSAGYFSLLTGRLDSLLVARRTIRQLAAEPDSVDREMTLHGARMRALHEHGMAGEVNDHVIMSALTELFVNPELRDDPMRHLDLVASGHLLLDAPHPERPEGSAS
jgi:hypothetical protein